MSVLITGASGALGRAVCQSFFDAGKKVIGVDRVWPEKMPFTALVADLSTAQACNWTVEQALQHGPIDALVHILGGFAGGAPVAETDDKTWHGMIDLNLNPAFYMLRAVLQPMIAARRGRIVAIGSRAAVELSPKFAAYAVSKAALVALVKNVAAEVRDSGITANVILPSTIDTAANRNSMPNADFSRWVKPESIAKLLIWLASEEAGEVSGAAIPIYGRA